MEKKPNNLSMSASSECLSSSNKQEKGFAQSKSMMHFLQNVVGNTATKPLTDNLAQPNIPPKEHIPASKSAYNFQQCIADVEHEALRYNKVTEKMYLNVLKHVSGFMKVIVDLYVENIADPQLSIDILLPKTTSVEDMAIRIEAEYAFMNMNKFFEKCDSTLDLNISLFTVIGIYDSANIPLNFSSPVFDVIESGDHIKAFGNFVGEDTVQENTRERRIQNFTDAFGRHPQMYESKTLRALHNAKELSYFHNYCVESFEVQNLLFWLEVQVFRYGACKSDNKNSKFEETVVTYENPEYEKVILHARYIYSTFLHESSTLKLNCPSSMIEDLNWPFPQSDVVTGMNRGFSSSHFDEIQEFTFLHLAFNVYPKFENSQHYEKLKSDEDVDASWIPINSHSLFFETDSQKMKKNIVNVSAAAPLNPKGNPNTLLSNNYYGSGPVITTAQRIRRIQREKKLRKFFGDAPIAVDSYLDAQLAQFPDVEKRSPEVEDGETLDPEADYSPSNNNGKDDRMIKRKKAEKLQDFFGVTSLPREQLFDQKLVDKLNHINKKDESKFSNSEFDSETKKKLLNNYKKLKEIMGERISEDVIGTMILPLKDAIKIEYAEKEELPSPPIRRKTSDLSQFSSDSEASAKAKMMKKKKIDKIKQFLGEQIEENDIKIEEKNQKKEVYKPRSMKTKKYLQKKINKLQSVFGSVPPETISVAEGYESSSDSDEELVKGITDQIIIQAIASPVQFINFLKEIEEIPDSSNETPVPGSDEPTTDFDSNLENHVPITLEKLIERDQKKLTRKKRVEKLAKFFGTPAGLVAESQDTIIKNMNKNLKATGRIPDKSKYDNEFSSL